MRAIGLKQSRSSVTGESKIIGEQPTQGGSRLARQYFRQALAVTTGEGGGMDLLGRLAEWLDAHGWTQDDPAGQHLANGDSQVRVTISFRGRQVDLVRPRQSRNADETSDMPAATKESRAATDKDHVDGSLSSHAPDDARAVQDDHDGRQPSQDNCAWPEPRQEIPAASFWDALDPTEREA